MLAEKQFSPTLTKKIGGAQEKLYGNRTNDPGKYCGIIQVR